MGLLDEGRIVARLLRSCLAPIRAFLLGRHPQHAEEFTRGMDRDLRCKVEQVPVA